VHRQQRHRLGFVCTAILVATGIAAFVGLRGTVADLDASLDRFYERTAFTDMTIVGGDAAAIVDAVGTLDGVASVSRRGTTTLSVFLDGGTTKVQGTIIGVPAAGPYLDQFEVTAGTAFGRGATGSVAVVEQHTADDLAIAPGATVEALGIGGQAALEVTGIGRSPEYLLPAENQQQVVTTPGSFAVLYVPEPVVEQLGGDATVPQVLVRYGDGVDRTDLDDRIAAVAVEHEAALVEPRIDQPSNAVIAEEHTGFDEASIVIATLALVVAALVGAIACARVDDGRRRRRALTITVVASAVVGIAIGLVAARRAGPALVDAVSLPEHVSGARLITVLVAAALAAVTGAVALTLSALVRSGADDTLGAGPAIVTTAAAAAAVICIVAPVGVVDSAEATLAAAGRLERVSAQIAFATPVTDAQLDTLRSIDSVVAAEAVPSANVVVRHGSRRYATSLEAFAPDTTMQRFETVHGEPLELPTQGALIPESLGAILDAAPGDDLEITLPGAGVAPFTVPVAALTSDTLGNLVFLRTSTLRDAMGADADSFAGGLFDTATVRYADGADDATIARTIQAEPDVVVYVPVAADLNTVAQARPIFSAVIDALLAVGAAVTALGLACAVVVHASARRPVGSRRVALEVLGASAVGIVIGAVLGTFAADRLVDALDTDLIHLVRQIDGSTYGLAVAIVVVVGAVTLAVTELAYSGRRSNSSM
jgi:putative ABC transport system permease protein